MSQPAALVFPAGTYLYSVSPNFAKSDTKIIAIGKVILRYTGVGNAVIIDGGAADTAVSNMEIGRFIVQCPKTALHAVFVRAVHHSKLSFSVRGAGLTSAGLCVNFAVCSEFDVAVTPNESAGWYNDGAGAAIPAYGFLLDKRAPGEFCSYSTFRNPICEGVGIGCQLVSTIGNTFIGGTFEGCSIYGIFASTASIKDRFYGCSLEVNAVADIYCQGDSIEFLQCDTTSVVDFAVASSLCKLIGGEHQSIVIDAGARATRIERARYNRLNTGGTYSDSGVGTVVTGLINFAELNELPQRRTATLSDDFFGAALSGVWATRRGSDGAAALPVAGQSVDGGIVRAVTGAGAGASMAVNGTQLDLGALQWTPSNGGLQIEFRVRASAIANLCWFIGLTDQISALEIPFTLSGETLAAAADDSVGVLFDTDATVDNWWMVGVAATVLATKQNSGVAPVANTWETWRIEVSSSGVATFYRNGAAIGTAMAGATAPGTKLTPVMAAFSRAAASVSVDMDYIDVNERRV